ncbi:MAG: YidC/Oxa1 family membrane protein insertase [Candidatus Magasanikbacteria bacterium]|nr:YidC/Oxa1 family membrane protein insertase [Candidatus Magasanikbacteria bacterium]
MLSTLWFAVLYQPLFNTLIWIYSNVANENLGWAVIWLTIFLRILLLPLSIISEYNEVRHQQVVDEAGKVLQSYKNDRVAQKEVARQIMKKYHMSPWAKVLSLIIQLLVLILLYQVFIRGITGDKVIKILYSFIDFPGKINTNFYGFEIGRVHDWLWAGIASVYLFVSIFLESRGRKVWERSEMYYLLFFPLFTFIVLWYLPMVKSLFILTTMIFSDTITLVRHIVFPDKKKDATHH